MRKLLTLKFIHNDDVQITCQVQLLLAFHLTFSSSKEANVDVDEKQFEVAIDQADDKKELEKDFFHDWHTPSVLAPKTNVIAIF